MSDAAARKEAAEAVPNPAIDGPTRAALPRLRATECIVGEARASGVPTADLRAFVAELRRGAEPDARAEVGPDPAGAPEPLTAAAVDAELDRLAELPRMAREAGFRALRDAARRAGCAEGYACPPLAELRRDVDARRAERRAEAADAHRAAPLAAGEVRWPLDFAMRPDGLFFGGEDGDVRLSSPFAVEGEARDGENEAWGLRLAWRDQDGEPHAATIPHGEVHASRPGELEGRLHGMGLWVTTDAAGRARFRRALAEVRTARRVRTVARGGWHRADAEVPPVFMLADGRVIGTPDREAVALGSPDPEAARRYGSAGSLEGWRAEVAAPAVGNPLAAFAISGAFAGPLLDVLRMDTGGVHLCGRSKAGKTLAAALGLSAWGNPRPGRAMLTWNNTPNALEAAAEGSADALLVLDEAQQADPAAVLHIVYALAGESDRGRLNRDATTRPGRRWRTLILSTGEQGIPDIAAKAGRTMTEGAAVRLPSVPIPADGLWPELHGHAAPDALFAALRASMEAHHGTAAPAFLAALAEWRAEDDAGLRAELIRRRDALLAGWIPDGADNQVRDVARRFGLVALAGELARLSGVLPWPDGEATAAARTAFGWWLGARGGAEAGEAMAVPEHLRRFLTMHGTSRLQLVVWRPGTRDAPGAWEASHDPARPVRDCVGWRYMRDGAVAEYVIPSETWSEAFPGMNPKEAARVLAAAGHLLRDGRHHMTYRKPPGEGMRRRMYVVLPSLYVDPSDAAPGAEDEL